LYDLIDKVNSLYVEVFDKNESMRTDEHIHRLSYIWNKKSVWSPQMSQWPFKRSHAHRIRLCILFMRLKVNL